MKMLIVVLLIWTNLFAQSLEELYNSVLTLGNKSSGSNINITSTTEPSKEKCGFSIVSEVKANFNRFTTSQQKVIMNILSRPERQTSVVSSSGFFRIHFDTTGTHAPDYFPNEKNNIQLSIDSLVIAFDSSYNFEINYLGYEQPPDDEGDGGDDLFDVYITNLGTGYYGYTDFEKRTADDRYKSFMVIDNKMDVPTPGINGVRVTAAHEFHHAIQVGSYRPPLSGDEYYFELTSTSMEEFVYNSINDYYNYLPTYFKHPDRRFTYNVGNTGYDRVIWNIYLKEKFGQEGNDPKKGFDIIKKSWEIMRNHTRTAIEALSLALSQNGLDIKSSFNDFGAWCYFTGNRAQEGKYFSEAGNYPLIRPLANYEYFPPKKTYSLSIQPIANNYLIFDLGYSGINDTLVSIVTNGDVNSAAKDPYPSIDYTYSLMTNPEEGSSHIVNEYYSKITSDNRNYLTEIDILNDQVVEGSSIPRGELDHVYPQPYSYYKHSDISLAVPVKNSLSDYANLYIYTISMNLVYNAQLEVNKSGRRMVKWSGLDNNGNTLPSGIYIYVTDSNGQILKGKLAIIND
ncbi:MAG: hypothetical protein GXO85_02935 [Chlorobi bacterium]|nr:hypothetical protein [Chlorobiota bacterium]